MAVCELKHHGTILVDAIRAGKTTRRALIHVDIVDAFAAIITIMLAPEIYCGTITDGAVKHLRHFVGYVVVGTG